MDQSVTQELDALFADVAEKTSFHGGFPYNLDFDHENLGRFLRYSLNNLGDPYVAGSYAIGTKKFEQEVISYFGELYNLEDCWGYVTACGTEGNYYGIWLGTRLYPDAHIVTSKSTHYSVAKAAAIAKTNLKYVEIDENGEMNYEDLVRVLASFDGPVVLNLNIGSTVTGAVDCVEKASRILKLSGKEFHLHCDGALGGMLEPFLAEKSKLDFGRYPIGSISVSGHKFIGAAIPCGIVLARRELVKKIESRVEYIGSVDTTIMGSRSGLAALFIWQAIRTRDFRAEALKNRENAVFLFSVLGKFGWEPLLNTSSTTVVFTKPDEPTCQKWQLSTVGDLAHIVVMQNHSREWINRFWMHLGQRQEALIAV